MSRSSSIGQASEHLQWAVNKHLSRLSYHFLSVIRNFQNIEVFDFVKFSNPYDTFNIIFSLFSWRFRITHQNISLLRTGVRSARSESVHYLKVNFLTTRDLYGIDMTWNVWSDWNSNYDFQRLHGVFSRLPCTICIRFFSCKHLSSPQNLIKFPNIYIDSFSKIT